jgi:hypothetical protein
MNDIKFPMKACIAIAALLLSSTASAAMYKWVDEQGVTNYSNKAPSDRRVLKLDEQNTRVNTIRFPTPNTAAPARAERLEEESLPVRRSSVAEEAAAREAFRRWRERCIAQRRVDCDDPYAAEIYDPGYILAYPSSAGAIRLAPGSYRPTPRLDIGGGGVVGPYYRSPAVGSPAAGAGAYGIGGGYNRASPGGVVVGPGSTGIGGQYYPVPPRGRGTPGRLAR